MHDILLAFTLTMLAGLSTGIGSCIAFVARHTNKRFLSVSLGFSVGVMIYVSFIEIFSQAQQALVSQLGQTGGSWATAAAFFGGMLAIAVIDRLIPSQENPHEPKRAEAENAAPARRPNQSNVHRPHWRNFAKRRCPVSSGSDRGKCLLLNLQVG